MNILKSSNVPHNQIITIGLVNFCAYQALVSRNLDKSSKLLGRETLLLLFNDDIYLQPCKEAKKGRL